MSWEKKNGRKQGPGTDCPAPDRQARRCPRRKNVILRGICDLALSMRLFYDL